MNTIKERISCLDIYDAKDFKMILEHSFEDIRMLEKEEGERLYVILDEMIDSINKRIGELSIEETS